MSILLAFDSSWGLTSVAAVRDGQCRERRLDGPPAVQSGRALAAAGDVLGELGCGLSDVSVVAFGAGPGGFTGVRMACSLAQGLGAALGIAVVAVGSLDALALASGASGQLLVAADARLGEVYTAQFLKQGETLCSLSGPECVRPGAVSLSAGDWIGVGSGFGLAVPLPAPGSNGRVVSVLQDVQMSAKDVAMLALGRLAEGQDPAGVAPLYVRNNVAMTVAERAALGFKS